MPTHTKILAAASLLLSTVAIAEPSPDKGELRSWVQQMKQEPRGPFSGIRWYCKDGTVLPPKSYGCAQHGGGFQHGEWSPQTRRIRDAGYPIANILVKVAPADVAGPSADPHLLGFILIEKFLIAADEGWILRRAQFYRGAFQDYNERDSANAMLQALLASKARPEFAVLREAARLLPHGPETASITRLRAAAAKLAERDSGFKNLRAKIHNLPEAGDAARVRAYAASASAKSALASDYADLAAMIDRTNAAQPLQAALRAIATGAQAQPAARLRKLAEELERAPQPEAQLRLGADALLLIRDHLPELGSPKAQLAALDTSIAAETAVFAASRTVLQKMPAASRAERMAWMGDAARAVYGLGLLTERERAEIEGLVSRLDGRVRLSDYREDLTELSRAAAWPAARLEYHFGHAIARLTELEPLATAYIPDRLRGSPLLFYSDVLESLTRDADRLSGTRHRVFGRETSGGLRSLNPGLARGVLLTDTDSGHSGSGAAIYLVPETTAELPAAAGILTAEEGNALSHVQLLARNLGIPNVVVVGPLHAQLTARRGRAIVVAASSGGVVQIEDDSPQWDKLFQRSGNPAAAIVVNPGKLELWRRDLIPTSQLRASDSGRIAGPKAAQVGELAYHFPGQVSPGLAVPFGVYREVLEQPVKPGGPSMFDWLKHQYAELAVRKSLDPVYYQRRVPELLSFVRGWLQATPVQEEFRDRLRHAMHEEFGMEGTYGVFVRSDTNVEDLPGFTGAGLNLTLPNVIGVEATLDAVRQVWASPFTERAFGWRQGLMDQPEHVYASVLLHRSVPNEKSGVMVTANLDTGDRNEITVVTNNGVGGGVDGQAAETLRVALRGGAVRLLSSATAPTRRVLDARGGVQVLASSAPDAVLSDKEIGQLVEFVRKFPKNYPGLEDAEGQIAPADIEFGFAHGQLQLLQIRPFLRSAAASRNRYLVELDAGLRKSGNKKVNLRDVPEENAS